MEPHNEGKNHGRLLRERRARVVLGHKGGHIYVFLLVSPVKARDWLADRDLAIRGARGKFSNDAKVALNKAIASGVKFDDFPKVGKPVIQKSVPAATKPKREVAVSDGADFVDQRAFRYEESTHIAYEKVDGKKVERSLRSACNKCRLSLVVCYCDEPFIVARDARGSVRVYIELR